VYTVAVETLRWLGRDRVQRDRLVDPSEAGERIAAGVAGHGATELRVHLGVQLQ
jgi:hypothetical protein